VVAAEVPELGREALPGVEDRLAAQGLGSVWRLSPDLQLGVTSLRGGAALERLISVLRGAAAARVGVSPVSTDLAETPRMLHFARVALASSPPGSNGVALFDDAPLAVVIASAPDTATRITRTILGPLLDLPRDERGVLVDTLATWFTSVGSAARTAQKLYCHASTARHRLHRIEQQTGRSLDDPNAVAELRLALETIRWLPNRTTERPCRGQGSTVDKASPCCKRLATFGPSAAKQRIRRKPLGLRPLTLWPQGFYRRSHASGVDGRVPAAAKDPGSRVFPCCAPVIGQHAESNNVTPPNGGRPEPPGIQPRGVHPLAALVWSHHNPVGTPAGR
jgi:hypothetical protein